ncbi:response regulator [Taibaiella helva]|uniref:response regulator n=1 Tax=Taibaiella helva TaxID=2301235 RepID=UPI000E57D65E|nr:response regulator transcription factor [Taibaiella helva]
MPITVAITDDHPLAIEGLQNMLLSASSIRVKGTYTSAAALMEGLTQQQPDVLLLDILLPDQKGTELVPIIRRLYPDIKIVALTSLDAPIYVRSMIRQGCKGYVLKNTDKLSLVHAIEQVYNGQEYIEPSLKEQMFYNVLHQKKHTPGRSPNLTSREKEILQLIVAELTSQQIADKLFLSLRTVETHRFNLHKKLEVSNNVGLAKAALLLGLVE